MQRGALFDSTGQYRYHLWREWDRAAPRIGFIMLNPSRADDQIDDPTMRRCIGLAQAWGYGALETANLFAYCTAYPIELRQVADPIGRENDHYLRAICHHCDQIILAWGNGGMWQARDRAVLSLLADQPNLYCLGLTQLGQPRHPLYIPRGASLLPLRRPLSKQLKL